LASRLVGDRQIQLRSWRPYVEVVMLVTIGVLLLVVGAGRFMTARSRRASPDIAAADWVRTLSIVAVVVGLLLIAFWTFALPG
jgi:uncharacterized membrane protein YidH (DUF202 family)